MADDMPVAHWSAEARLADGTVIRWTPQPLELGKFTPSPELRVGLEVVGPDVEFIAQGVRPPLAFPRLTLDARHAMIQVQRSEHAESAGPLADWFGDAARREMVQNWRRGIEDERWDPSPATKRELAGLLAAAIEELDR